MKKILVLNGPNLSRLGSREPEIYGDSDWADLIRVIDSESQLLGLTAEVRQSNSETELISWVHEAVDGKIEVILNPAAFTHYSYSLRDACAMLTRDGLRLIEVHISNPQAREAFRHSSVISGVATGVIAGFGIDSYRLALQQLSR